MQARCKLSLNPRKKMYHDGNKPWEKCVELNPHQTSRQSLLCAVYYFWELTVKVNRVSHFRVDPRRPPSAVCVLADTLTQFCAPTEKRRGRSLIGEGACKLLQSATANGCNNATIDGFLLGYYLLVRQEW